MNYAEVFEDFTYLDLGTVIITMPSNNINEESKSLFEICKDLEIVKWLPIFGQIKSLSDAHDYLTDKMLLIVSHQNLFLTLKFKASGRTFGYINVDTPNEVNFNTWMFDFCIESACRNNGVMYSAINSVLAYLHSKGISYASAVSEPLNVAGERLLKRLCFTKIIEKSSEDYNYYLLRLN